MSGYPVAVKVHNSVNQEIYVIAYAINASSNVKDGIIKASDIYVLDTSDLKYKKLSDYRYALNNNKKYSLGIYENHSLSYEIIPVSSINLNKTSIILPLGGSTKLTATPNPNNASDKKLTWASSNTKAVTVSEGTVKAVAAGTSTVTVTSKQNSSAKKSCSVTVVDTNGMVNYAKSFKGKTLQECKDMFDKQKVKYEPYSSEWCSWFVYTMYKRYGVINYNWTYGKNAYGSGFSWADNWRGLGDGRFHKRDGYTPKPGDIIIYDWDYDGGSDHVGMVIKVANNKVYTIEGNQEENDNVETNYTERIVKEKERDLKWSCIIGYYSICNY